MSSRYNSSFLPMAPKRPLILDPGMSAPIDPKGGIQNMVPLQDNTPSPEATGPILQGQVVYTTDSPASPDSDEVPEPESTGETYPSEDDPAEIDDGEEQDDSPTPVQPSNATDKLLAFLQALKDSSSSYQGLPSNEIVNLTYQPTNFDANPNQSPIIYPQINVSNLQSIGQIALARAAQRQTQTNRLTTQQAHQQIHHILDQRALSQGLPTYWDFHSQHGIAYPAPPDPGTLGIAQLQAAQQVAAPPISAPLVQPVDYSSLAHAQAAQNLLN